MEAILAACAVADSTGDWTSLRFLITWRGCPADDLWDVPLSAFGTSPKDCLAAANAVLADSYAHFAYLGIPASAFRCETLLKAVYVNWRHFDGAWLGAPAAVALAGARQQRLSRVADSFPVAVPALSDSAFEAATGRAPAFDADWVNPNKPAKTPKAPKSATKAAKKTPKGAKGTPKAKLPKVQKKPKAAKKTAAAAASPKAVKKASVKKAAPAAEKKKPGPKPKAAKKASPEPKESEEEAAQEEEAASESEEDEETPPAKKKKAAVTPKKAAASGAASPVGATPKRKPGRPAKTLPFAASPAAAAEFAAAAVAKRAAASPPVAKKRGRPSNADKAARAAAAAAAAADDEDDSS